MCSNNKTINLTNKSLCKEKLSLKNNEIHIWSTKPQALVDNHEVLSQYIPLLNSEELAKQQRYKFAKDRHDALITRAFIRDLLSYYAEVKPKDWEFEKGEKGKPEVINCPIPLRFNISHTKNLIICAVTLTDDIGCDVENMTRGNDVLAIAERYFAEQESDELFSLAKELQRDRFFDYWTLKESYIKAWGLGLSIPLTDFSFKINDSAQYTNALFTIKNDIQLSFAEHRQDTPDIWRSWLLYPTTAIDQEQSHRIAISLRSKVNNQAQDYKLRFFNSLPLYGYQEF